MLLLQCYKIIEEPKPYEIPLCGNYSAFAKGAILAFEKVSAFANVAAFIYNRSKQFC